MAQRTSSEIVVREARNWDLDQVVSTLHAANAEFEPVLPEAFYRAYLANVLDVRSRLVESELYVATESERRIVGTITLYPDASRESWGWPSGCSGIRAVAVEPSARGLGIGRLLAEHCIERSRALGARSVSLHTAPFMEAAIRMYERLGFRRAPKFDGDAGAFVDSAVLRSRIPALAYRLDLGGTHRQREGG
jgi:ribosomal protein S18 acetylase RimI-like enzyme